MHRYGFIAENIKKEVRRIDFHQDRKLGDGSRLEEFVAAAVDCLVRPGELAKHIEYGRLAGKSVARAASYESRLALRLINRNIVHAFQVDSDDRQSIVSALKTLLSECVRYRVYKLDVRSFYESFDTEFIDSQSSKNSKLTGPVKRVIRELVRNHSAAGNSGLPRGLLISASLSDALMGEFDSKVLACNDVFFYRRYVDDLTIVTSNREDPVPFIDMLERLLPPGLSFKKEKKKHPALNSFKPKSKPPAEPTKFTSFDYLGYSFNIARDKHFPHEHGNREVWLDIASSKVKKIKTRIVRSFLSYMDSGDFPLLEMRIKHLTTNISLIDRSKGITRLSGIHHSYPLISTAQSESLRQLDRFLSNALCSTSGSIFQRLNKSLTTHQRTALARHSFYAGAKGRIFYQLSVRELGRVQRCWKYG